MDKQFNEIVTQLKEKNKKIASRHSELSDQQTLVKSLDAVQGAIIGSIKILVTSLLEDTLQTKVTNFPTQKESIKTPDALVGAKTIKDEITLLKKEVADKSIDLNPIIDKIDTLTEAFNKLPTSFPDFPEFPKETRVNNLKEIVGELQSLSKEVKAIKLDPKIEVKTPEVKIDLSKELAKIEKAVNEIPKGIVIPQMPEFDVSELALSMLSVKETIENLKFPVPNFRAQEIIDASLGKFTERFDIQGNIIYIGTAPIGTLENEGNWIIKKYDLSDLTDASGKATPNGSWTSRTTETYA
jgi:hypothetical protein